MNENYIKEYEEMSLCDLADELVEPLFTIKKDLAKTIYIHYAEERDKNYELQQENKQLKDKLIEINEVINGYMPNQYAMCKAFDEIEFIISKEVNND